VTGRAGPRDVRCSSRHLCTGVVGGGSADTREITRGTLTVGEHLRREERETPHPVGASAKGVPRTSRGHDGRPVGDGLDTRHAGQILSQASQKPVVRIEQHEDVDTVWSFGFSAVGAEEPFLFSATRVRAIDNVVRSFAHVANGEGCVLRVLL
jgi:hypothetical protein